MKKITFTDFQEMRANWPGTLSCFSVLFGELEKQFDQVMAFVKDIYKT